MYPYSIVYNTNKFIAYNLHLNKMWAVTCYLLYYSLLAGLFSCTWSKKMKSEAAAAVPIIIIGNGAAAAGWWGGSDSVEVSASSAHTNMRRINYLSRSYWKRKIIMCIFSLSKQWRTEHQERPLMQCVVVVSTNAFPDCLCLVLSPVFILRCISLIYDISQMFPVIVYL